MKTLCTIGFVVIPVLAFVFVSWHMWRRETKQWQAFACLAVLAMFASLVLGTLAGQVTSFGYGDAKVEAVREQVEEVRKLRDEMRQLAQATAGLMISLSPRPDHVPILADDDGGGPSSAIAKERKEMLSKFLKQSGVSDEEIKKTLSPLQTFIDEKEKAKSSSR